MSSAEITLSLLIMLGMPTGFATCAIWLLRDWKRSDHINRDGVSIHAEIVDRRYSPYLRPPVFAVTYRFVAKNGQEYSRYQQINDIHFKKLKQRTQVEIKYIVNDPGESVLAGDDKDNTKRSKIILLALVLLALWIALIQILAGGVPT